MKQIQQVGLKWILLFLLMPVSGITIGQNPLFVVDSTYLKVKKEVNVG